MATIPIYKAKAQLSELIERACAGEQVVISRSGAPAVVLVPVASKPRGRRFGALEGLIAVDERFFEPLPEEELAAWEGQS